jgi:hypothetical protein
VLSPDAMAGGLAGSGPGCVQWRGMMHRGLHVTHPVNPVSDALRAMRGLTCCHALRLQATCASSACCGPSSTWRWCWSSAGVPSTPRTACSTR